MLRRDFEQQLSFHTIGDLKGIPWLTQFRRFVDLSVLVGIHGGGLAWVWAMQQGGAVIEFRPGGVPTFILACGNRWDVDGHETFGGIARLALIHHICVKPADAEKGLGEEFDLRERDANITIPVDRLRTLLEEALILMNTPRECEDIARDQI